METEVGVELTEHEESCVKSLKRLAKKWRKEHNRLWLYAASGMLFVMMGEDETNPNSELIEGIEAGRGGVNPANCVCKIDIPNDGGDW